ncbi:MAG TPA: FG-GAP-like repeat-containing protein [Gemmataceae bacterium]
MDLDGDGTPDLISGSWPGELFFFKGQGKGQYAAPVKLKNKDGKTINIGGGRRPDGGGMILIAGDAKFEKDEKTGRDVIVYDGERIVVPEGKSAGITGTASAVHAVDWNGDGVIDLLVGDIGGNVYLVPNEGTPQKWAFGKERQLTVGGKELRVDGGDAGPFACDWDGDGKTDLLVGAGDGSVWFYRNVGTKAAPELAAGVRLVAPGDAVYGPDAPKEPRRGIRSKVCAVDWFGTGRLDLLVGDMATQKPDRPEPTPKEKAEQDQARKELEPLQKRYRELIDKLFSDKPPPKDEKEKVQKELTDVQQRMAKLQEKIPPDYEDHGWVWLFRRQPAAARGP